MRARGWLVLIVAVALSSCNDTRIVEPYDLVWGTISGLWAGTLEGRSARCVSNVPISTRFAKIGTSVTGTSFVGGGTLTCGSDVSPIPPRDEAVLMTGTAIAGTVTFLYDEITLTGSYDFSRLDATGRDKSGVFTWRQTRQ